MGFIYKIENINNGKIYVGQTKSTINKRWSSHKCDVRRKNTPLYLSMKKYENIDSNFKIYELEEVIDILLDEREIYWITYYDCRHPKGYNMSEGGSQYRTSEEIQRMRDRVIGENNPMYGKKGELNPFYGKKHTENSKSIMSKKAKNRIITEETKIKIGQSTKKRHSENGHPFQGSHHKEETKLRISEKLKGRKFSDERKNKMSSNSGKKTSVEMFNLKNEFIMKFESLKKASEWLSINTDYKKGNHLSISSACSGRNKTAYGYKWKYSEGRETNS